MARHREPTHTATETDMDDAVPVAAVAVGRPAAPDKL